MPLYAPGSTIRLPTTFTVDDVLTDPGTVTLTVVDPENTQTVYTGSVVNDTVGTYHQDIVATVPGIYSWKWVGTSPAAGVDEGTFTVEASLLGAGLLCSVDDVRAYLQKPDLDVAQDDVVSTLIARASRAIATHTSREFGFTGTATRRFRVDGPLVLLDPYDLQSATLVSLDPTAASPQTLTADTDYILGPLNSKGGTYQSLHLGSYCAASGSAFGYGLVDITGVWGMASVPEDVKHACVLTVAMWMRRDVQAISTTFNMDDSRLERPEALPSAVRGMLAPYRRIGIY